MSMNPKLHPPGHYEVSGALVPPRMRCYLEQQVRSNGAKVDTGVYANGQIIRCIGENGIIRFYQENKCRVIKLLRRKEPPSLVISDVLKIDVVRIHHIFHGDLLPNIDHCITNITETTSEDCLYNGTGSVHSNTELTIHDFGLHKASDYTILYYPFTVSVHAIFWSSILVIQFLSVAAVGISQIILRYKDRERYP